MICLCPSFPIVSINHKIIKRDVCMSRVQWHLQKTRKLKQAMKIEAERLLEEAKQKDLERLSLEHEQKLQQRAEKSTSSIDKKGHPITPRAKRIQKLKREGHEVESERGKDIDEPSLHVADGATDGHHKDKVV